MQRHTLTTLFIILVFLLQLAPVSGNPAVAGRVAAAAAQLPIAARTHASWAPVGDAAGSVKPMAAALEPPLGAAAPSERRVAFWAPWSNSQQQANDQMEANIDNACPSPVTFYGWDKVAGAWTLWNNVLGNLVIPGNDGWHGTVGAQNDASDTRKVDVYRCQQARNASNLVGALFVDPVGGSANLYLTNYQCCSGAPTATPTVAPPTATRTPTRTLVPPTVTPPPPATDTPTATPVPPTATATNTAVPPTNTAVPTETPVPPTATLTPMPTATPAPPTATPVPPDTPAPTETPTPTGTPAPPTPAPPTPTPDTACLGDFVWLDSNQDGLQDPGEAGLAGVTVNLLDAAGAPLATTASDALGGYQFCGLAAGTYALAFSLPAGYTRSPAEQGSQAARDSDSDPLTGRTPSIALAGLDQFTWDAGYVPVAPAPTHTPLPPPPTGTPTATPVPTDTPLPTATRVPPSATPMNTPTSTALPPTATSAPTSTPLPPTATSAPTSTPLPPTATSTSTPTATPLPPTATSAPTSTPLPPTATSTPTPTATPEPTACLGDFVWHDSNANGVQDAGETGLPGVTVTLAGRTTAPTTSVTAGHYQFCGLPAGAYTVTFAPPAGYAFAPPGQGSSSSDTNPDPPTGQATVLLGAGVADLTIDAGLYQPARLGDYVWRDANGDGVQDAGETGSPQVTVELLRGGGVVSTTRTGADGHYDFAVTPGVYQLHFVVPAGLRASPANRGGDAARDADADPVTGLTPALTLVSGQRDLTWDAGLWQPARACASVWFDANQDGVWAGGETPLADVPVFLWVAGAGAFTHTGPTDAAGQTCFENLPPGNYYFTLETPTAYRPSTPTRLPPFTLVAGASNTASQFGNWQPTWIGDRVWEDRNGNGLQEAGEPGLAGVAVDLRQGATVVSRTVTTVDGAYGFADLLPGVYQVAFQAPVGYVFTQPKQGADDAVDSDAAPVTGWTAPVTLAPAAGNRQVDAGLYRPARACATVYEDLNVNGVRDAGEPSLAAVTLTLYGAGEQVGTATTDVGGQACFADLAPGAYYIAEADRPAYLSSTPNRGPSFTLAAGSADSASQFGDWQPSAIGDTVWQDGNKNAMRDAGEVGLANVALELLRSGVVLSTTVTDAAGHYQFPDLPPGSYVVNVVDATVPTGLALTTANDPQSVSLPYHTSELSADFGYYQPADICARVWHDLNANGQWDAGEPALPGVSSALWDGRGQVVATAVSAPPDGQVCFAGLLPGAYTVVATDLPGWLSSTPNTTAPLVIAAGAHATVTFGDYQLAAIGDTVWLDSNLNGRQDAAEAPVAGVNVTLYDAAGVPTATTTDATGHYRFAGRQPGAYKLGFTRPAGYAFTQRWAAGVPGDVNSDADPQTGTTVSVFLASGQTDLTWDAGLFALAQACASAYEDLNVDGAPAAGEPGLAGATVTLYDAQDRRVGAQPTAASGEVCFADLAPGAYHFAARAPSGYQASTPVTGPTFTLAAGGRDVSTRFGAWRPATLGGTVWDDADRNGRQDAGEGGIPNVGLRLACADGTTGRALTDAYGQYLFGGLPPGMCVVTVDAATVPAGDTPTYAYGPQPFPLAYAADQRDVDFGYAACAELGGVVWLDRNGNGRFEAGEPGYAGATVTLLAAAGRTLATGVSAADGAYRFVRLADQCLPPGAYTVRVSVPSGYASTTPVTVPVAVPPAGRVQVDFGVQPAAPTPAPPPQTPTVPPAPPTNTPIPPPSPPVSPTNTPAPPTNTPTAPPVPPTATPAPPTQTPTAELPTVTPAPTPRPVSHCVTGVVFDDRNGNRVQDPGEPGVPGVEVLLLDPVTGRVLQRTLTDDTGHFNFCGPITCYDLLVNPPPGYELVAGWARRVCSDQPAPIPIRQPAAPPADVPEPSTWLLLLSGLGGLTGYGRRRLTVRRQPG